MGDGSNKNIVKVDDTTHEVLWKGWGRGADEIGDGGEAGNSRRCVEVDRGDRGADANETEIATSTNALHLVDRVDGAQMRLKLVRAYSRKRECTVDRVDRAQMRLKRHYYQLLKPVNEVDRVDEAPMR